MTGADQLRTVALTAKRSVAFVNTGTGRNLGDRAMLLAMMDFVRARGIREIHVPADLPQRFRDEFGASPYPLFYHCQGRLQWLHALPGGAVAAALCTWINCLLLAGLRRVLGRALPWTFMEAAMVNTLARVDAVILSGGGYLTDEGRLECRGCLLTALLARLLGKRILLTGQGIGPFNSWLSQRLMAATASAADLVAVRDPAESALCLVNLGVATGKPMALGDDAFSLAIGQAVQARHPRRLAVHFRQSAIVGATATAREQLTLLIHECRRAGWEVRHVVFSARPREELEQLTAIDPALDPQRDILISDDPRELCRGIAECSAAIGFAYHFVVFALCQGVPVRALHANAYYRQKMLGLLSWFGCEDWGIALKDFQAEAALRGLLKDAGRGEVHAQALRIRAAKLVARQQQVYASALAGSSHEVGQ